MGVLERIGKCAASLVLALLAASPVLAAEDFGAVLAKAKQEGLVVVHGGPKQQYEPWIVGAFSKAYPDIKVQFDDVPTANAIPKVLGDRQIGVYDLDVWVSGAMAMVKTMQPAGMFQPLLPVLRPEIMRDDKWKGGFAFGWMDRGRRLVYAFDGTVQKPIWVNWDFVPKASINSLRDLLQPALAAKSVWRDPRVDGFGNGSAQSLLRNLDRKTLIDFFKAKIVLTTDARQLAEWVATGIYPIGIGLQPENLREFQAKGLGKNITPLPESLFKVEQISTSFGGVGFMDRAPHPNAAIVFINWLLSKEGQDAYAKIPRNSRRSDVQTPFPQFATVPGRSYFIGQEETVVEEQDGIMELAKQTIEGK